MAKARDVLGRENYTNYRNVRAALVLFVVFGTILVLGGLIGAADKKHNPQGDLPPAAYLAITLVGLTGVVGGISALFGSPKLARLAYVMAVPYLFGFPLGTVMGYTVLTGLSGYLDSKERLKRSRRRRGQPRRVLE